MNRRQHLFVLEYCVDLNATQAAKRAGYSERTAHQSGYELLKKPEIQQAIRDARAAQVERIKISADDVVLRIDAEARDPSNDTKDRLKALELLGRHTGAFEADNQQRSITINFDGIDAEV
ncbi:MAG: terminase small subunit [Pseudomonadota bacterium]